MSAIGEFAFDQNHGRKALIDHLKSNELHYPGNVEITYYGTSYAKVEAFTPENARHLTAAKTGWPPKDDK
ncbi:hypothetical protein ACIQUG_08215 [Ensifer sp. NPDC090286]|uniref:hypothetical protein n=1 Tax=Ensifer sp. NPDC090286 TaxID=3363991 RepID=UPI00383BF417